jgi:hypothetical protein
VPRVLDPGNGADVGWHRDQDEQGASDGPYRRASFGLQYVMEIPGRLRQIDMLQLMAAVPANGPASPWWEEQWHQEQVCEGLLDQQARSARSSASGESAGKKVYGELLQTDPLDEELEC